MARASAFVAGMALGLVLGTAIMISHADDVSADVSEAAAEAHVSAVDLQGAVNSTGVDPYTYLRGTGELPPPKPTSVSGPVAGGRVACIVARESQGNPNAHNASGASGLGQFLPSTWRTTPQGQAGLSVYNPTANRAAIAWMLSVGRAREFDAVRYDGC